MPIYTARVELLCDGIADPRGSGTSTMTHHAYLPNDGAAEEWGAAVLDNARSGALSSRWLARREEPTGSHWVRVYRRTLETRRSALVWEDRFALGDMGTDVPFESGPFSLTFKPTPISPDPSAAVLVVEKAYSGTSPVQRRCYVGPLAAVAYAGQVELLGSSFGAGVLWVPGPGNDSPPDGAEAWGLWRSDTAALAGEYLAGMWERARDAGGYTVVVQWASASTSQVVEWVPHLRPAHLRSRSSETLPGASIYRNT